MYIFRIELIKWWNFEIILFVSLKESDSESVNFSDWADQAMKLEHISNFLRNRIARKKILVFILKPFKRRYFETFQYNFRTD